jgi:hypothetical protein
MAKIMKILIVNFSLACCRFLLLRFERSPQYSAALHSQMPSIYALPPFLMPRIIPLQSNRWNYSYLYFNLHAHIFEKGEEERIFRFKKLESFPEFNLLLIPSIIQFWYATLIPIRFAIVNYEYMIKSRNMRWAGHVARMRRRGMYMGY